MVSRCIWRIYNPRPSIADIVGSFEKISGLFFFTKLSIFSSSRAYFLSNGPYYIV